MASATTDKEPNVMMSRSKLIATLSLLLILSSALAQDTQSASTATAKKGFKAFSGVGCEAKSWAPEVYSFYGDSTAILAKLDKFDMELPARRIYLLVVETASSAELLLFERTSDKEFDVKHYKASSLADLREQIATAILANKGVACVGEQTKAVVAKLSPEDKGNIPSPASARSAFGHTVQAAGSSYTRATVFLLC
jgi:hypothetical protein